MGEKLEQYFPGKSFGNLETAESLREALMGIENALSMAAGPSRFEAQSNEILDIRTIGAFVFVEARMPEGQTEIQLPFKPPFDVPCESTGEGAAYIGTDGILRGTGTVHGFCFLDEGG